MARNLREITIAINGKLNQSLINATTGAAKRIQDLNRAVAKNNQQLSQARGKLFDAVGLAAAFAAPIKAAVSFESAMADVRKVVDGLDDPKEFKAMSKEILEMTTKGGIPMAAEGLAQIAAAAGQAGIARKDISAFAKDAAKMGIAFDVSAEEAGNLMASWRTAFRLNQKEVAVLADKINLLGNTTAASAPKISEVVTRIGPLGEVGGLASGQIAALAASMVAMGISPEIAATGIKKLIITLSNGSAATDTQKEAFEKLGLSAEFMAKKMQKDATGAITQVFENLRGLEKYEQVAVMKQLFGAESIAAIGALLPGLEAVQENMKKVGDSANYAGSMQKEFESRAATTENSLLLLNNQIKAAGIGIGSVLLPEITKIVGKLGPLIERLQKWADKNPELFSTIVKVSAALVALRIAMLAGSYATLVVKGGILEFARGLFHLSKVFKLAQIAQYALNLAMTANPIGLIIAGVALLAGGIYLLVKNWDKVRVAMISAWNWFVTFATEGPGKFIPIIGMIGQIAKNWDRVRSTLSLVTSTLSRIFNWIKKISAAGLDKIMAAGGKVKAVAKKVGQKVSSATMVSPFAKGGIITQPTYSLMGEAGAEAVIPLSGNRSRAESLWNQVGNSLGVQASGNINYSPVINISGNANKADVESALAMSEERFKKMYQKMQRDERRVAMA